MSEREVMMCNTFAQMPPIPEEEAKNNEYSIIIAFLPVMASPLW